MSRQATTIGAVVLACEAIGLVILVWGIFHFAPLVERVANQVVEVCS